MKFSYPHGAHGANPEEEYEMRIKEIEEYYVKTLLNDDQPSYGSDRSRSDVSLDANAYYTSHGKGYLDTPNYVNLFSTVPVPQPKVQLQPQVQQQIQPQVQIQPQIQPQVQLPVYPNLEVEIKPQYNNNSALPLTSENLHKMQQLNLDSTFEKIHNSFHIQKTTVDKSKSQQQQSQNINKELYKTELCESFTTKGFCKYGNKCQFAHGLHELKLKKTSNNFRTKPCINWNKLGYCPYGKRCCFKHGDDRDIQIYKKAGTYAPEPETSSAGLEEKKVPESPVRQKNLHAKIKKLQKMTW